MRALARGRGRARGARPGARRPLALGVAGGLLYGAADLAIKAVTGRARGRRLARLAVARRRRVATAGAFFASSAACRTTGRSR